MKKNRLLWLGVFIAGGLVILIWGIFLLGRKESIFVQTFRLHSPFEDVAGLREGVAVRLSGMDIGVVETIRLPDTPGGRVLVTMRIDAEARNLIRKDAYAVTETEGLVGNRLLSIRGGSLMSPRVSDEDTISSQSSLGLAVIVESFNETASDLRLVTQSLEEITAKIKSGEGTIGKLVYDDEVYRNITSLAERSEAVFSAAIAQTQNFGEVIDKLSSAADSLVTTVRQGKGTLGALIYRTDLHDLALEAVNSTHDSLQALIAHMRYGEGVMGKMVSDELLGRQLDSTVYRLAQLNRELNDISKVAHTAVFSMAENMEALKHNWFFKGYFERRGFWSQTEFEKHYAERKRELEEYEKQLQAQGKILDEQYKQVQQMKKLLEQRLQAAEKLGNHAKPDSN